MSDSSASKSPIGVLVHVSDTSARVLSLSNTTTAYKLSSGSKNGNAPSFATLAQALSDYDGLGNTDIFEQLYPSNSNAEAAYMLRQEAGSEWFIPSVGEWMDLFSEIGLSAEDGSTGYSNKVYIAAPFGAETADVIANVEDFLVNAGAAPLVPDGSNDIMLWSSTKASGTNAVEVYLNHSGGVQFASVVLSASKHFVRAMRNVALKQPKPQVGDSFSALIGSDSATFVVIADSAVSLSFGASLSGHVVLPSYVVSPSGYSFAMTAISPYACSGNLQIRSLVIPTSVSSIGLSAFSGCSGVDSVFFLAQDTSSISWADASVGADFMGAGNGTLIFAPSSSIPDFCLAFPAWADYIVAHHRCVSLGDVYYSDGSTSASYDDICDVKSPVGVVVHADGEVLTLVAMHNLSGDYDWGPVCDVAEIPNVTTFSLLAADTSGLSNTASLVMQSSQYQAAYAARSLGNGWYLPAAGELFLLAQEVGGSTTTELNGRISIFAYLQGGADVSSHINALLANAGADSLSVSDATAFWTSSEASDGNAIEFYVSITSGVQFASTSKLKSISYPHHVRAFKKVGPGYDGADDGLSPLLNATRRVMAPVSPDGLSFSLDGRPLRGGVSHHGLFVRGGRLTLR